jgi:hypothetical protein
MPPLTWPDLTARPTFLCSWCSLPRTDFMFSTLLPSSELTEHRGMACVVCLHVALSGPYTSVVIHSFVHSFDIWHVTRVMRLMTSTVKVVQTFQPLVMVKLTVFMGLTGLILLINAINTYVAKQMNTGKKYIMEFNVTILFWNDDLEACV